MTDVNTVETMGMQWAQDGSDWFLSVSSVTRGSVGWVVSTVLFVFAIGWAFFGHRGFRPICLAQGILSGIGIGVWVGLAVENALALGRMDASVWLEVPSALRLSAGSLIGGIAGGTLLGLLSKFWARLQFFCGGGLAGVLLTIGVLRLLHVRMLHPLFLVLLMFLVTGAFHLWLSVRFPAVFTGVWGGLVAMMAFSWPMLRLFVHVGGPTWLPFLASGGLGVLVAIAGTALQLDREAEKQSPRAYRQEGGI